jgi:glucose-6-phosphate 1-dehydrogenase
MDATRNAQQTAPVEEQDHAPSDALVFFGASGDLAYKKIFPALQAMVKHGVLDAPVIGVAKSGWGLKELQARAKDSVEQHGGLDQEAFAKLLKLLNYIDGDYADAATFQALRKMLGTARRPAHYLAIPPVLFGKVVEQLSAAGCAPEGARVIVEKPFGRDLRSARALNQILLSVFDERHIFRIDHYLGKGPVRNLVFFRFSNALPEAIWNREHIASMQITMAESFGVQGRGAFYEQTGTLRDVVQNHLFQILANVTMEPPARMDAQSLRDEKVKVLKAIPTLSPDDMVRGQFRGYRKEPGVAPQSQVETFVALRLFIDNWRWQGVPFYFRAGKCLKVTCTEVVTRLRRPPQIFHSSTAPDYVRARMSPVAEIAMGINVLGGAQGADGYGGQRVELLASREPGANERDAYELLLHDAMQGDQASFAREDYVEEAWRIVDPIVKSDTALYEYDPGTWGPAELEHITPPGGWSEPKM